MLSHVLFATDSNPGEPPAEELLRACLAWFPLPNLLRDLASVGAMVAQQFDRQGRTIEGEIDILRRCCGQCDIDDLVRRLRAGEFIALTDENQLANLAMFAVSNRSFPGIALPGNLLRIFGLFNKLSLQDADTGKYFVAPDSLQGTFSVANTYRERQNNVIYRYRKFMDWSDAQPEANEIRAAFSSAKGMSYREYAQAVVYLDEYFWRGFNVHGVRSLPELEIHDPLVLRFVRAHSVTPEGIDAFAGPEPLKKLRDYGIYQAFDRPLLRLGGEYHLLHMRALENALGAGVFYAALPAGAQQRYFAFVGRFFEQYMDELLQRLAELGAYSYSGEIMYLRSRTGKTVKSTDHFLYRDGSLIFVEDRFARMSRRLLAGLDADAIDEVFRKVVFTKFEQLNANVVSYLDGDFEIPGVARNHVHNIYPLVALPHAFPRSPAVQKRFDAEILARNHVQGMHTGVFVKPYEVIEAESLEGLVGLDAPPFLPDVLDRKAADAQSRADFFKNQLVIREGLQLRSAADFEMRDWYRELESDRKERSRDIGSEYP